MPTSPTHASTELATWMRTLLDALDNGQIHVTELGHYLAHYVNDPRLPVEYAAYDAALEALGM